MKKALLLFLIAMTGCSASSISQPNTGQFDFIMILTRQDREMDWWYKVPSQFGPMITQAKSLYKGEYVNLVPIFKDVGFSSDGSANIIYNIDVYKPDVSAYHSMKDQIGCVDLPEAPGLIPAEDMIAFCFQPDDPFGDYTVTIAAFDHIKNKTVKKSLPITLKPFSLPPLPKDQSQWYFDYPVNPDPASALSVLLNGENPFFDDEGHPIWAGSWFYKIIFEQNDFLIPHMVDAFDNGTSQQQQNILLILTLMNKAHLLSNLSPEMQNLKHRYETIVMPDPYAEISSADQLDMLWAECFATSRQKPIRHIISAFNHYHYVPILDKIKAGELDAQSEKVQHDALLAATFLSAHWSVKSNCQSVPLVYRYFVGLYHSKSLNQDEKSILEEILKEVAPQ